MRKALWRWPLWTTTKGEKGLNFVFKTTTTTPCGIHTKLSKPLQWSTQSQHNTENPTIHWDATNSFSNLREKPWELTFFQPFSFPSFFSFLSKQQAPMLLCVECRAEWGCRPLKCLSQSDYSVSKRTKPWLTDAGKRHSSSDSLWAVRSD